MLAVVTRSSSRKLHFLWATRHYNSLDSPLHVYETNIQRAQLEKPWQQTRKLGGGHHKKKGGAGYRGRLKGHGPDRPDIQISKTISWLVNHGATNLGLHVYPGGWIRIKDLLSQPLLRGVDLPQLEEVVNNDKKKRWRLCQGARSQSLPGTPIDFDKWWLRAALDPSVDEVELDIARMFSHEQLQGAVHRTTMDAWKSIRVQGISRLSRNHIHLSREVLNRLPGTEASGSLEGPMVTIHINTEKALRAGIKFYLSSTGVVLTSGNEFGILEPQFFEKVVITQVEKEPVFGWGMLMDQGTTDNTPPSLDIFLPNVAHKEPEPPSEADGS